MQRQPYQYNPVPLRANRTVEPPDISDDDAMYITRRPTSARRYIDPDGNQVFRQGNKQIIIHNQPPPKQKIHWLLILGVGMALMLILVVGGIWFANWWTNHQLDVTYGYPRTYQTDAVVGHGGDSAVNPSHFIFLNLNAHVVIIELPAGDASKAIIYRGPTLYSDNADLIPVTGEFKHVNGTVEMLVHIQDQTILYVSDGSKFTPK